jgi:unsaturated rhamnogalacturonyl hydrolase
MLTYTIAKGVRLGYLPSSYFVSAQNAYNGMREYFIEDANGRVNLKSTVTVSGLGGEPYRDGSFEYYMSEPVITNDPKGLGAFILCAAEMEKHALPQQAKGKQILLDNFYNNEVRKDARGVDQSWHYVWNERDNNGYSFLKDIFQRNGASTHALKTRPTLQDLSKADVYIIVDPDTERESTNPNFIAKEDIDVLKSWVNNGGTLVLLGNDSINAEFQHFNALSDAFGIHFEQTLVNPVLKDKFEMGEVRTGHGNPIFQKNYKLFIKELSPLRLNGNAQSMVEKDGKPIMATVEYGKGRVFALGDPWVYNEYVDGRKLPSEYENFKAAEDWVKWLLKIKN